ncbi:uncharacterized protein LOC144209719 [Stigmatopora nigra]
MISSTWQVFFQLYDLSAQHQHKTCRKIVIVPVPVPPGLCLHPRVAGAPLICNSNCRRRRHRHHNFGHVTCMSFMSSSREQLGQMHGLGFNSECLQRFSQYYSGVAEVRVQIVDVILQNSD